MSFTKTQNKFSKGIDDKADGTAVTIDETGNVGVGVPDPDHTLAVKFDQTDTVGDGNIGFRVDNTYWSNRLSANPLADLVWDRFYGGNHHEAMRVQRSTGKVGIGTDDPAQLLSVGDSDDTSTNYIRINQRTSAPATIYGGLEFFYDNTAGITGVNAAIRYAAGSQRNDGELTFHTGSSGSTSETMRIDSSGKLGIGTSDPSYKTEISTDGTTYLGITSGDTSLSGILFGKESNKSRSRIVHDNDDRSLQLWTNSAERVHIDSVGNVGIGTDDPESILHVNKPSASCSPILSSGTGGVFLSMRGANGTHQIQYGANASSPTFAIYDAAASATRMSIDASGHLLVGTTTSINSNTIRNSSLVPLNVYRDNGNSTNSLAIFFSDNGGTEVEQCKIKGNGNLENRNNAYGSTSDARLKSNIVSASSQLDDIMSVQIRSYTLKSTGDTHIGVVAQELEAAGMSGLVSEDEEGMKSVKYSILYLKAIKALQEAVTRIETLEAEVAALKKA